MNRKIIFALVLTVLFGACNNKKAQKEDMDINEKKIAAATPDDMFLLVGTYTSDEGSRGIYVYKFDTETGKADSLSLTEVINPSYLVVSADEKFVYSVGENGDENSAAHAFAFDKKRGVLQLLNSSNTESSGPCYIEVDKAGKSVLTANYGSGSISSFQVKDDGTLLPVNQVLNFEPDDTARQKSSHLHSIRFSPDERFLFATDLGADKIYRYNAIGSVFEGQPALSETSLKEFSTPAGTGPRHFDFHPGGNYFYVLGELSGDVIVYDYDEGDLKEKQVIATDSVEGSRGSADIHVSPDGKFLYASNRIKEDGVAIFSINQDDGTLTKVGYQPTGKHPRNFVITPNGKLLLVANRDDNVIQIFKIDNQTGLLIDTQQNISINKPVCLKFAVM
ncbi:MAG: lactonase family protein [Bacteroidia bacterium]|nr:lactonase family protein [Bacteroidia bacterium]